MQVHGLPKIMLSVTLDCQRHAIHVPGLSIKTCHPWTAQDNVIQDSGLSKTMSSMSLDCQRHVTQALACLRQCHPGPRTVQENVIRVSGHVY
jgi:hypothetical protein